MQGCHKKLPKNSKKARGGVQEGGSEGGPGGGACTMARRWRISVQLSAAVALLCCTALPAAHADAAALSDGPAAAPTTGLAYSAQPAVFKQLTPDTDNPFGVAGGALRVS